MEELESSLEMYELQLGQVKQALEADKNNADLIKLNDDLQQLITLTTQNILEEKKKALLAQVQEMEEERGIVSDTVPESHAVKSSAPRAEPEAEEPQPEEPLDLGQLEGMKCKAPFRSRASLGSVSMHNAIIFQTEPGAEGAGSLDQVLVRVVFSHPTSTGMVPCPYYLEGKCRFSDGDCKFSHGEIARLSELGEFEEPNYDLLKAGCAVIAKDGEGSKVWAHAKVEGVEGELVHVRFTSDHKDIKTVAKEAVFPLTGDDDDDDFEADDGPEDGDDDDENLFVPVDLLDRLNPEADKLGDWEQHTRGIASRLMQKMGYVMGTGLGKDPGSSRVVPVTATIYPQGKSLDWCMELRERAGGGDILSVEKTLRRQQAKEEKRVERRMAREKEREKRQNRTFDFINQLTGVRGGGGQTASFAAAPGPSSAAPKTAAKKRPPTAQPFHTKKSDPGSRSDSAKSLNVRSLQVGEEIRRAEREMAALRKTYERRRAGEPAMAAAVKRKMEEKERLLRELRGREGRLNRDKTMSESKKKLTIF